MELLLLVVAVVMMAKDVSLLTNKNLLILNNLQKQGTAPDK